MLYVSELCKVLDRCKVLVFLILEALKPRFPVAWSPCVCSTPGVSFLSGSSPRPLLLRTHTGHCGALWIPRARVAGITCSDISSDPAETARLRRPSSAAKMLCEIDLLFACMKKEGAGTTPLSLSFSSVGLFSPHLNYMLGTGAASLDLKSLSHAWEHSARNWGGSEKVFLNC